MALHKSVTVALVVLISGAGASAQPPAAATRTAGPAVTAEPPRFADPARREKLARAFPEIDRAVREFLSRQHVPGAAWAIVIDGELAHAGFAGSRRAAAGAAPVDADTVFRIASMTKSFTAMAVLSLRDAGKLSLDDPVERHVPELRGLTYPTGDSPPITIRHLLSHSAGFPEDNPWGDQQLADSEDQLSAMMRRGFPFSNPPGIAFEYSNLGFAILGRVVSRVSGMPYRQYIASHILRPLGMNATTLEAAEVDPARLAHGYRWEDETWKEEPPLPDGAFGSMGGMLTSVRDLSRYVAVFLEAWPPRDGAETGPVRRASLREMQQVARFEPAMAWRDRQTGDLRLRSGGYGFGLGISQTCDFGYVVSHSGGLPGFGSQMRWLPDYGVGFIGLGSLTYTGWSGVAERALSLLAKTGGLQPREAQPSPALRAAKDAVSGLVSRWDEALADRIAAVNLFLDRSKDRRRREFEQLRSTLGSCRADQGFEFVENALRGEWLLRCDRGQARAEVTLAPTLPPTVQYMEVQAVSSVSPRSRSACPVPEVH